MPETSRGTPRTTPRGTQSFARSMFILEQIATASNPPTRAELQSRCDLTRPTLYRIISSLQAEGLIESLSNNRYKLGARLICLARTALSQNDIRSIARPALVKLRDATAETVHLAIRHGDEMVYIDKIESSELVRMASTLGTRVPFHATSVGKAYISALSAPQADELIATLSLPSITKFTTTNRKTLHSTVSKARVDGYVCDKQENEMGIVCFGAAICEHQNTPVASISVSVPVFRLNADPSHYSNPLLQAAADISAQASNASNFS